MAEYAVTTVVEKLIDVLVHYTQLFRGIGKTTPAKKVCNDEAVREHFECHSCAWIIVSQSYKMEKLPRMMTKKIGSVAQCSVEEMDTMQKLIDLRQYLQTIWFVFFVFFGK